MVFFKFQSLFLKPQNANTYTAIGFVQALNGDLENAIKNFHKSLALKRDDVITSSILKLCIEDLVEVSSLPKALSTEGKFKLNFVVLCDLNLNKFQLQKMKWTRHH